MLTQRDLDELRVKIAETMTPAMSKCDIVTQAYVHGRIHHYMGVAKEELRKVGPEESGSSSGFTPKATIIMPDGTEANIPVPWKSNADKNDMMYRLSKTCEVMSVAAVMLRVAVNSVHMEKVAKAMNLNWPIDPFDTVKFDYFEKRLYAWIKQTTGGDHMGDLPKEYKLDLLAVWATGPRVPSCSMLVSYEWHGSEVEFKEQMTPEDSGVVLDMFPKWWD